MNVRRPPFHPVIPAENDLDIGTPDDDSDRSISTAHLARVHAAYTAADVLFIDLVGAVARPHLLPVHFENLSKEDYRLVSIAFSEATRMTRHWSTVCGTFELKAYARDTLTGVGLRDALPSVAAEIEAPWNDGIKARFELHKRGARSEECASRLISTWRLSLADLLETVTDLVGPPTPDETPGCCVEPRNTHAETPN